MEVATIWIKNADTLPVSVEDEIKKTGNPLKGCSCDVLKIKPVKRRAL